MPELPLNVYALVQGRVVEALDALTREGALPAGLDLSNVEVSPPRDAAHGDLACNAAMVLAKAAKMKPRDIADQLAAKLKADPDIERIEVAGPGFLNMSFVPAFWHRVVTAILKQGAADYGRAAIGKGEKVDVEYVSANPTGPMHVGHGRGAVFGDALANLLQFAGYRGDARILHQRCRRAGRCARPLSLPALPRGAGRGDRRDPGRALSRRLPETGRSRSRRGARPRAAQLPRGALAAAGARVRHRPHAGADQGGPRRPQYPPRGVLLGALTDDGGKDEVRATIEELVAKGLVYQGRLPRPKGHDDGEWEDREQTLFKSTQFGDDVDRALQKSDGGYTYFASDMAYHRNKIARGFQHLINVFGADHVGYITRMKAAVAALSDGKVDLDIKVCQLVKLFRGGEPVKMSKRAGTFVTLRDVVDEVGPDPVRFMMLYRKNDAPLDFDLAKVVEQSKDNPVFYVQYAHARAHSVFRNVAEVFPQMSANSAAVRVGRSVAPDGCRRTRSDP